MPLSSDNYTRHTSKDIAQFLLEKYTREFPRHCPQISQSSLPPVLDTILLIGSRGSLGANILAQLLSHRNVRRVYTLNRNHVDGKTSRERQEDEFHLQGLDPSLAFSERMVPLQGQTSHPTLGLPGEVFEEVSQSVTAIIANGWRVEFRSPLSDFEDLIAGIRNLIDISLRSPHHLPPYFLYCSSLGLLQDLDIKPPIPETFLRDAPPIDISGEGYRRSKWVVEGMINAAVQNASLRATVARIGQISGSVNGYWKTDEWFPIMVKSSQYLGCLPKEDRWTAWISAPLAASTIIDLIGSDVSLGHIVHSNPISFTSIASPLSRILGLELVSRKEWLRRLELSASRSHTDEGKKANPAVRMLPFFHMAMTKSYQGAFNLPVVQSVEAERGSESLRLAQQKPTGEEDVLRWVESWQRRRFLLPARPPLEMERARL